ncbi:Phosphatidylinositol-glycan biosynthesis class X protein [Linum perenne]
MNCLKKLQLGYILESYFRKHQVLHDSSFQDLIHDELSKFSCKMSGEPHLQFLLSGLERHVIGEGSHRSLSSTIQLQVLPESSQTCKLVMIERLPSGVFADPFELDHLLQRGVYAHVGVFGDTNLELPSVSSSRSAIEIHMNLEHSMAEGGIKIDLPLHARYAVSLNKPLQESGYSEVTFGTPDLLVSCNTEGSSETRGCLLVPTYDSDKPKTAGDAVWEIPCGIRSHTNMVTFITFATAFVSTLVIVIASVFYSKLRR